MDNFAIRIIMNFSIVLPALAAVVKLKAAWRPFLPFFLVMWIGLSNEALSLAMIYTKGSNGLNSNFYVLAEFLLILWQFYRWSPRRLTYYLAIALLGLGVWTYDNFMLNHITGNNSLFRMYYSMVIAIRSVELIGREIIYEEGTISRNPVFMICIGFLFYYACNLFVESYNLFRSGLSREFLLLLWKILYFVNTISNLIYAYAILWIPKKQKFILRY